MLLEEIKDIKSTKSDLRKFGITVGAVVGLICGLLWYKEKDTYSIFAAISFVLIFSGLVFPVVLKPLQKAWMTLAVILGWFMTRVILSILFYIVFSSIGLISKLFNKQFLDLKKDKSQQSYWIPRDMKIIDKEKYEKQF
jgi:hypothetical protein